MKWRWYQALALLLIAIVAPADVFASPVANSQSPFAGFTNGSSCTTNGTLSYNGNSFVACTSGAWAVQPVTIGTASSAPATCNAAAEGMLYFDTGGTAVKVCTGSSWTALLSGAALGTQIPAAGSTGDVQFNSSGALAGSNNFYWNNTTGFLGIGSSAPITPLDVMATQTSSSSYVTYYNNYNAVTYSVIPGMLSQVTATATNGVGDLDNVGMMGWVDEPSSNTNPVYVSSGIEGLATAESNVSPNYGSQGVDGEAYLSGTIISGGTLIGVNGYAEQDSGSSNAGTDIGGDFQAVITAGTASNGIDGINVNATNAGGTVTNGMNGIYVEPDINGGTVDYRVGLYVAQGDGSPTGTDYGIYQESSSADNYFGGVTGIGGTPSSAIQLYTKSYDVFSNPISMEADLLEDSSAFGEATALYGYLNNSSTATGDYSLSGIGGEVINIGTVTQTITGIWSYVDNKPSGSQTNTSSNDGIQGASFEAQNDGSAGGTIDGVQAESYNDGTASKGMDGLYVNAGTYGSGTLTGGLDGIYVEPDISNSSTVDYRVGLYLAAGVGAPSTSNNDWGIYQESTSAVNYFGGNVGIGTATPESELEVYGGEVQIGSSGASCTGTNAGALRYASGSFYYCNGSIWTAPSGGGGGVTGSQYQMAYLSATNTAGGDSHITTDSNNDLILTTGDLAVGTSTVNGGLAIYSGAALVAETSDTYSSSLTVNWASSNQQYVTLTGNTTIAFSNYSPGELLRLIVCQGSSGGPYTVTWPTVAWTGGTAPTLTTTASQCDVLMFLVTNAKGSVKIFGTYALNF